MTGQKIRLQKLLRDAGISSRRKCEELIEAGRVTVAGRVAKLGDSVDPARESVTLDGKPLSASQTRRLFLFHKPRGVVTTLRDPENRPTVGDYTKALGLRVFPVGRLDFDVCGLLLLTNDGEYANALAHPRYETTRVYLARVEGSFGQHEKARLLEGIELEDGEGKAFAAGGRREDARSAQLVGSCRRGESIVEIEVREGRNHFVKRLLAAAGLPVLRLARVGFGPFKLGNLAPGEIREAPLPRTRGK